MQNKKIKKDKESKNRAYLSSIIAIVVGLLFGYIVLMIANPEQATDGFIQILTGAVTNDMKGIGQVFYYATPIMLTGLSVAFAFKTGLFNIGTPGQFIVGAYAGVYVGVKFTALGPIHWIVALLAACIAGAIWALVPGVLKAFCNVNEVISAIMMNYIGMYLVNYLLKGNVDLFNTLKNESNPVADSATIPKFGLDKLFEGSAVGGGIIIAIIIVIIMYIVLNKTTFGFELKAVGFNREASKYAGINEKRGIILSMAIAGALAGIAGGLLYLGGSGKYIEVVDVLAPEGFNGISVALLGLSNPIGVAFSAIFIAYITQGGFYLQLFDFAPEIIDIIIAVIIYFSAFALILQATYSNFIKKRRNKLAERLPGKPAEQTIEVPIDELEVVEEEKEGDDV
ncbi:MAG: ABC transporter permease [bacterium]|nr:ABC transporter permease [bacterium]